MLEMPQLCQNAGMVPPPSMAHDALQNVDALFGGTGVPLPSTFILDYMYGIAAYKAWRSEHDDGFKQMNAYREDHFVKIPLLSPQPDDTDDTDVTSGPDDPNDSEYKPPRRSGLEETMDELYMFLMYIHGITKSRQKWLPGAGRKK